MQFTAEELAIYGLIDVDTYIRSRRRSSRARPMRRTSN
jgi:hypothetical protein